MKKKLLFVVILLGLSNCEAIFVEDISNDTIVLLAPSNNSMVTAGTIQFNWQEMSDATEYEIQIATPNFMNASQIVLDSLTSSSVISKDLVIGEYEWRVKALNSDFSTQYSINSFSVN